MSDDKVNGLLMGLGALAEALGFFYDCLIDEGFDRQQAMEFCGLYMVSIVAPSCEGGNERGKTDEQGNH